MVAQTSVGFFGKLPCNGDFLQRRVPQAFLEVWDPWLQECVHTSRQALQESWLSAYLTSPLWRFVLPSAVCGSGAYAGVLAPSVDRVGRYFPLTLVTQVDVDTCPLEFATQCAPWFEALESLVVTTMEASSIDLQWFDDRVASLVPQLDEAKQQSTRRLLELFECSRFPEQGASWRAPLHTAAGLQAAINGFAYRDLAAQLRPASIWWTEGSAATAPSWLCLRGLPTPEHYGAMLSGQWTAHGWSDLGELGGVPAPSVRPIARQETVEAAAQEPVQSLIPRVTLPEAQLTAIEANRAAFVVRPDIGLWATVAIDPVAASDTGTGTAAAEATAVRMIADALQQLAPAPSLTGLVESVRQTLAEVHGELRRLATRDVLRIESQASVVAMLAAGAECAFLSAGPVQKLRVRARVLESIDATETPVDAAAGQDSGSLMDLLTGSSSEPQGIGASGFLDLHMHYERLQREDQWILCARQTLGPVDLEQLAATAASGMPIRAQVILDTLTGAAVAGVVPMMTVEI
jgi:type VI secretion system protein ImpM